MSQLFSLHSDCMYAFIQLKGLGTNMIFIEHFNTLMYAHTHTETIPGRHTHIIHRN